MASAPLKIGPWLDASPALPAPSCSSIEFAALDTPINSSGPEDITLTCGEQFDPLNEVFRELLTHLRFQKPPESHGNTEPCPIRTLKDWADHFCFAPRWDKQRDVRMAVDEEQTADVGTIYRCILSSSRASSGACKWMTKEDYLLHGIADTSTKLCMCTIIRVPDLGDLGIRWKRFLLKGQQGRTLASKLRMGSPVRALIATLLRKCQATQCPYGVIADSTHTLFMLWKPPLGGIGRGVPWVYYQLIPRSSHSTVYCVAAITAHFTSLFVPVEPRLVAPPSRPRAPGERPQCFRDFPLDEMENDRPKYEEFLRWKSEVFAAAVAAPFHLGAQLPLERNVIPRKLEPLRCSYDWVPVPDDCETSIFDRRPRCALVDELLQSGDPLVFRLTRTIRANLSTPLLSQVFAGQLGNATTGAFVDTELCIKLFDERRFNVPTLEQYDESKLDLLYMPDEMIRREEAVYHCFSGAQPQKGPNLQGLALPHCYGFHEFTVEDATGSRTVLGVVMEYIEGVSLRTLFSEVFGTHSAWPHEERLALLRRLRNLVRVLNHAHVSQKDWHDEQVVCIRRGGSSLSARDVDMVLIDFALATQIPSTGLLVPASNDVGRLWTVLHERGLTPELMKEVDWNTRDEWET